MPIDRILAAVPLIAVPAMLFAQEPSLGPDQRAAITAQRIAAAIGLDDKGRDKATELLLQGETEVAALRAQCAELHREIDAVIGSYLEQFAVTLEADQAARLEALMASGTLSGCRMGPAVAAAPEAPPTKTRAATSNTAEAPGTSGADEPKPAKGKAE